MTPDARIQAEADQLEARWRDDPRWAGVERTYRAADAVRLRGSVVPEHTLARNGAERLWELLQREEPVRALGAMTGGQAVQMVKAGLEAIYLSGWQVAADANASGSTYPDQSLYPANSAPQLVKRLNNALQRAEGIDVAAGRQEPPEALGADPPERAFGDDRAAQPDDVLGGIRALDAGPALVLGPLRLQLCRLFLDPTLDVHLGLLVGLVTVWDPR